MEPIVTAADCCRPCADVTVTVVPGPAGPAGTNGAAGTNGKNIATLSTALFVQPIVGANVTIAVVDSSQFAVGQVIFVSVGGSYELQSQPDATHLQLQNLGYDGNAAPGANIPTSQQVTAGGLQGPDGSSPSVILNDISPTTTRGDIMVDNGANNPNASVVRLAAGTNGMRAQADSTQPTGLLYSKVDLADTAEVTGTLPLTNGGTGGTSAATARTSLGAAASGLATASGLTVSATDKVLGRSTAGAGAVEEIPCTAFARSILDDTDAPTVRATISALSSKEALFQGQEASAQGGTFTDGSWVTVPINTEVYDVGGIGSIAGNTMTLAAGTYRFEGWMTGYKVDAFQCRLSNIDTATVLAWGTNAFSAATDSTTAVSNIAGRFTLASLAQIRLEAQSGTEEVDDGFGPDNAFGGTMVYSSVKFIQE